MEFILKGRAVQVTEGLPKDLNAKSYVLAQ